jgi:hypothetical protein
MFECTDIRLLCITDQSQVYMPRLCYSLTHQIYFTALTTRGHRVQPKPRESVRYLIRSLNACSAIHKGALIDDLIHDDRLNILKVCEESWIRNDAPDVIKCGAAVEVSPRGRERSARQPT